MRQIAGPIAALLHAPSQLATVPELTESTMNDIFGIGQQGEEPATPARTSMNSTRAPLKINSLRMNQESTPLIELDQSRDEAVAARGRQAATETAVVPARGGADRWKLAKAAMRSAGLSPQRCAPAQAQTTTEDRKPHSPFSLFRVFSSRRPTNDAASPPAVTGRAAGAAVQGKSEAGAQPLTLQGTTSGGIAPGRLLPLRSPASARLGQLTAAPSLGQGGTGGTMKSSQFQMKTPVMTPAEPSPVWQTPMSTLGGAPSLTPTSARRRSRLDSVVVADQRSKDLLSFARHATPDQARALLQRFYSQRRVQRQVPRGASLQ
jgi:hypothetical protein